MAEWRARGYVQDSDEEEDSQGSISIGLAASREAVNLDDTRAVEAGEPHDVETFDRQDERGGLRVEGAQDEISITNAGEENGDAATPSVHGEKEGAPSPAVGHDGHDTEKITVDTLEDFDELQRDHYKATERLNAAYGLEARPRSSPLSQNTISFPSSLSSIPTPRILNTELGIPSMPDTQSSTRGDEREERENSTDGSGKALGSKSQHSSTKEPEHIVVKQNNIFQRVSRSLRRRNPIQLHPYAVESEQYRQTLKARGVKPLRIAQMEAEAAKAREEDSQNIEYDGEEDQLMDSDTEQPALYSSSPIHPHSSPVPLGQTPRDVFVFGDEDLPDMNTLLSHSTLKYVGNGHKRRKTAEAKSTAFRMPRGLDVVREKSRPGNKASSAFTDDDVLFDVPPLPPHSGSQTPLETERPALPAFRMPRRLSPSALPTPITSSEPTRRHLLEMSEDERSDDYPYRIKQTADTDDSTDAETCSSEQETSRQFQRAQRKIRGVLPASWLKLDLKTQRKKPADAHKAISSISPEKSSAQRGVARMVATPGSKSPITQNGRHEIEVLSDDEIPESDTDEVQQQIRSHQRLHPMLEDCGEEGFPTERWGEAVEDDQIDAMLPSATRAFHSRRSSKRQTKIGDLHSRSRVMAYGNSKKISADGTHQRKTNAQSNKGQSKKPEFHPPRLSILDTPLTKGIPQDAVPQFLKVASRTVRSRQDKGRHSPSRKFVRLATRNDTSDANEILQYWREGTILPSLDHQINEVSNRQPLYPRSANSAVPSRAAEIEGSSKASKLPAVRIISVRPHVRSKHPRKLQTSLDHLIERQNRDGLDPTPRKEPVQQVVEKPKKRGQIVSSLQAIKDSRPALLESAREDADRTYAQANFQRDLARVNHFDDDSGLPGVVVRRFFEDDGIRPMNSDTVQAERVLMAQNATGISNIAKRPLSNKRRKRQPHRFIVPETWPNEPSAPVILDNYANKSVNTIEGQKRDVLVGLGPFGTRYSDTLDVTPLPAGTCFSANTLLGSGAFAKVLKQAAADDLERSRGCAFLKFRDRSLRWGSWNDTVSSELGEVFEEISQSVQPTEGHRLEAPSTQTLEQVSRLQSSTLEYLSNHLSFLDSVDRVAFVLRCKGLLSTLVAQLIDRHAVNKDTNHQPANAPQADIQIGTLTLSLAKQLLQISKHELIPAAVQGEIELLVQKAVRQTLDLSLTKGLEPYEICLSRLRNRNADYRIQDHFIEAFVVAQHVLGQDPDSKTSVWLNLLKAVPIRFSDAVFDITLAEQAWKQLFTLLPFLELDAQGVVETGRRFTVPFDNWTLAKRLINPVLEASLKNPQGQPPSFNSYCRAIFGRCLHLTNGWGWRRCEPIIGMLFDYFARNGLAHLRNEESKGSPLFLERLDKDPTLTLEPEDRGFHIVLKIIGSGLRHMRKSYTEKKIRDVVWRLMPNHGRSHPKEEAIRQEHLDALRNHHDLLCTLYWASPPSCRPRLTVIRNLVNLETSHREACHINIRAWFNLVKFQLSTDEPTSNLELFTDWHNHLLAQVLRQHSLARTEAEDQVRSAQSVGDFIISKELLETTIARNQRQVEAILGDALVCLKLVIDVAQDTKAASTLLSTTLAKVFDLFDASRTQAHKPIIQALDVLVVCASKSLGSRNENEESQDYGDWSAFDDESLAIPLQDHTASQLDMFQDSLRHLLWNCFGADLVPDDVLLLKVVDVWVVVAQVLVRNGLKSWTDYLGSFGNDSWSSLRDTEQTRKYSVYYLATLLERDSRIYHDHKAFFLMSWVSSVVERESLLKFQHRLMSALLNTDSESPLLQNLPFWKDAASGRYQISASDFSDRRLSLISSVLSNMRVSLENAVLNPFVTGNELRQEFRDLLKHLMATMKRNYQELGHGSNVKGMYVDFVQRVVEFLQQHTSTICPIDRFFTDNGAFPLPATDPTYVVGQLKNYGLRLQDARTPKQLLVFLQSVSERAAVDGQQPYLVGQLHTAMSNAFENGVSSKLTLRSFLVKNIIPAYVEMAFSTTCGWVLAMPYLQALQNVFEGLLEDLDGANRGSIAAIASTIAAFLDSIRQSLETFIDCPSRSGSRDATILGTVSACYSAISALLPVLDYILRLPGPPPFAVNPINFFKSFALYFSAVLRGDSEADVPTIDHTESTMTETSISDIRKFATQELKDTLDRNWIRHDDVYYLIRGSTRREVLVDIGLFEEERAQLLVVLREFLELCRMMPALRDEDDDVLLLRRRKMKPLGVEECFF